ncbi:hypothetical protein SAMN05444166_2502 [Singulisphaera sp. GP187]|uniref:hypothetical protein n=1 Tax=Singulisphaera sp. GP187 TaxID=1882752 RepID=UPI0009263D5B|nr:hypothetical protein [Singulisphaera sp. GP187]SIO11089.1 hypothetical protein SAMN05444166_2502 [Singulisphaera sp. GP187]
MITITRHQVRRLRGVFRRHVLGITHRGSIPPMVLCADGTQLRAQYQYATLAIESTLSLASASQETVALPLEALAEFEGRDDSSVVLEALTSDRIVVRWTDHGVPQTREYAVPALDTLKPFPAPPADWATLPAGILTTLAEASDTASEDVTRYALNCIQLRGGPGAVAATDGHQLLIRGGFRFPWTEDLLIRDSLLFSCPALPQDLPVSICRTESHVVLGDGPWTLFLEIQTGVRFPALDHIIPDTTVAATRLCLDPEDARFLGQALDRLPGAAESDSPVTLELNGKVAIRARGADQAAATELVLARSGYTGAPVRLNTNREFLSRALQLGFTEIVIVDAGSPLVCRDREFVFCWQPLAKDSAIAASDDAIRIESSSAIIPTCVSDERTSPPIVNPTSISDEAGLAPGVEVTRIESTPNIAPTSAREDILPEARIAMGPTRATTKIHEPTRSSAATENQDPVGLSALIQEAESLYQTLTDARSRAGRLVVALRRHRRRERLVSSTLASIRALKLQDIAG